ncbi:MAG: hypothetical protein JWR42_1738 [Marmoricola sp.]|nr:hypothetical protein [Marmoricola sp.]
MSGASARVTGRGHHFQAVIDRYQAERRLPTLAVGVLDAGRLVWAGAAGEQVDPDTRFRIGSITKTVTAVLVVQCRDEGLLSLEDPLGRHVPESGYADRTVGSLLAHVSGMQSEPAGPWWERSPGGTVADLVARNDGSGAVAGPGAFWHYSNLAYGLLGEVVARVRGESWRSLVDTRVLGPLGMTQTSFSPVDPAANGWSVDHLRGTLTPEPAHDTGAMAPAGQLWSTIGDLARFAGFLVQGDPSVLPAATLREMRQPVGPALDYGLGVRLVPWSEGVLVGHTGSMPGFQAVCLVDALSGVGVVALTNATTGFSGDELALALLGGHTPGPTRPWRATPDGAVPAWAEELLGTWFWGNSGFEARWNDDHLELRDLARGAVVTERFAEEARVVGEEARVVGEGALLVDEEARVARKGARPSGRSRVVGVAGYHRGEELHVVRREDGAVDRLECATFVYTRTPYPDGP